MKRKKYRYEQGQILGCLTLLEFVGDGQWLAICQCSKKLFVNSRHLYRKQSCGCKSISNHFKKSKSEDVIIKLKYGHYKQGAKRRNLKFELSLNQFINLITENCKYCTSPPRKPHYYKKDFIFLNGVDRVDSKLDYYIENCVPCCEICNRAKSDMPVDEYKIWLKWIKSCSRL